MVRVALPGCKESQVLSSSLPSSYLTALTGGSDPNAPFCMHPLTHLPHWVEPHNPFAVQPSTLPGQLGMNPGFNLAFLLAGQLHAYVGTLPRYHSASLLKKKIPMWHPHCCTEPLPGCVHTPPAQKSKHLFG